MEQLTPISLDPGRLHQRRLTARPPLPAPLQQHASTRTGQALLREPRPGSAEHQRGTIAPTETAAARRGPARSGGGQQQRALCCPKTNAGSDPAALLRLHPSAAKRVRPKRTSVFQQLLRTRREASNSFPCDENICNVRRGCGTFTCDESDHGDNATPRIMSPV